MNKSLIGAFVPLLLLSVSLIGCTGGGVQVIKVGEQIEESKENNESDKEEITNLVSDFGESLQKVSLLAPEDVVIKSIQENYGEFISQTLLSKWVEDPQNAPGRMVSSPWPDRIEILSIEKLTEGTFEVKGEIIEVTSTEKAEGGIAAKRPITLLVKLSNNRWLIDDVKIGAYEEVEPIVYKNQQYGFDFSLPKSWKDYMIVTEKWEGLAIGGSQGQKVVEMGPVILIRHPQWTSQNQRQDIPIMIFTLEQWKLLQDEAFHIGAAPIGPSELGRNTSYIFALPARYNFAFPTGYEEVETILNEHALQPTEVIN